VNEAVLALDNSLRIWRQIPVEGRTGLEDGNLDGPAKLGKSKDSLEVGITNERNCRQLKRSGFVRQAMTEMSVRQDLGGVG